jgi:hypothetical protein
VGGHPHAVSAGELSVGVRLHVTAQSHMPHLLPALGPHLPRPGYALPFHAAETRPAVRRIPTPHGSLPTCRPGPRRRYWASRQKENGMRDRGRRVSAAWKTK